MLTFIISIVMSVVILCVVYRIAKKVTEPLNGISEFTSRINENATKKDVSAIDELESLQTGEGEVKDLVKGYQRLAKAFIMKKDTRPMSVEKVWEQSFPLNELYYRRRQ